jgi:hypothetical protein
MERLLVMQIDDLTNVEENQFTDYNLAPEGWHNAEVTGCKEVTSRNNVPGFEFDFETESGHILKDWVYVSPKSLPNVKARLVVLNFVIPPGKFNVDPAQFLSMKCMCVRIMESKLSAHKSNYGISMVLMR